MRPLREFSHEFVLFGHDLVFGALDYIGVVIVIILAVLHLAEVRKDVRDYAEMDPMPR